MSEIFTDRNGLYDMIDKLLLKYMLDQIQSIYDKKDMPEYTAQLMREYE